MIINNFKAEFDLAVQNREPIVFRSLDFDLPTWDAFIEALNISYNTPRPYPEDPGKDETHFNSVTKHIDFYLRINRIESITHTGPILAWLSTMFDDSEIYTQSGMMNLTTFPYVFPIHHDPRIMIYWNCIGQVEWKFFKDNPQGNPQSVMLNPGDMVIIPEGIFHGVYPQGPRAGITFSVFPKKT